MPNAIEIWLKAVTLMLRSNPAMQVPRIIWAVTNLIGVKQCLFYGWNHNLEQRYTTVTQKIDLKNKKIHCKVFENRLPSIRKTIAKFMYNNSDSVSLQKEIDNSNSDVLTVFAKGNRQWYWDPIVVIIITAALATIYNGCTKLLQYLIPLAKQVLNFTNLLLSFLLIL